jgi:hypothetical protein
MTVPLALRGLKSRASTRFEIARERAVAESLREARPQPGRWLSSMLRARSMHPQETMHKGAPIDRQSSKARPEEKRFRGGGQWKGFQ